MEIVGHKIFTRKSLVLLVLFTTLLCFMILISREYMTTSAAEEGISPTAASDRPYEKFGDWAHYGSIIFDTLSAQNADTEAPMAVGNRMHFADSGNGFTFADSITEYHAMMGYYENQDETGALIYPAVLFGGDGGTRAGASGADGLGPLNSIYFGNVSTPNRASVNHYIVYGGSITMNSDMKDRNFSLKGNKTTAAIETASHGSTGNSKGNITWNSGTWKTQPAGTYDTASQEDLDKWFDYWERYIRGAQEQFIEAGKEVAAVKKLNRSITLQEFCNRTEGNTNGTGWWNLSGKLSIDDFVNTTLHLQKDDGTLETEPDKKTIIVNIDCSKNPTWEFKDGWWMPANTGPMNIPLDLLATINGSPLSTLASGNYNFRGSDSKLDQTRWDYDLIVFNFIGLVNVTFNSYTPQRMDNSLFYQGAIYNPNRLWYQSGMTDAMRMERVHTGSNIIFNFPDAQNITANQAYLSGAIIAPDATFTANGGSENGQLVVKNYNQRNQNEVHALTLTRKALAITQDPDPKGTVEVFKYLKYDGEKDKQRLAGAEFILWRENEGVKEYDTGDLGQQDPEKRFSTDRSKAKTYETAIETRIQITELPYGKYYLEEIKPPPGFVLDKDIGENGEPIDKDTYFLYEFEIGVGNNQIVIDRYNEPETITLVFEKRILDNQGNLTGVLPNAGFKLIRLKDEVLIEDRELSYEIISDSNGHLIIPDIPVGKYILAEIDPPANVSYDQPFDQNGEFRFRVRNLTRAEPGENIGFIVYKGHDNEGWRDSNNHIRFYEDTPESILDGDLPNNNILYNRLGAASTALRIHKVDSGAVSPLKIVHPLSGAKFQLYRQEADDKWRQIKNNTKEYNATSPILTGDTSHIGYVDLDPVVSGDSGYIYIPWIDPGYYRLIEYEIPDGFKLNEEQFKSDDPDFPTSDSPQPYIDIVIEDEGLESATLRGGILEQNVGDWINESDDKNKDSNNSYFYLYRYSEDEGWQQILNNTADYFSESSVDHVNHTDYQDFNPGIFTGDVITIANIDSGQYRVVLELSDHVFNVQTDNEILAVNDDGVNQYFGLHIAAEQKKYLQDLEIKLLRTAKDDSGQSSEAVAEFYVYRELEDGSWIQIFDNSAAAVAEDILEEYIDLNPYRLINSEEIYIPGLEQGKYRVVAHNIPDEFMLDSSLFCDFWTKDGQETEKPFFDVVIGNSSDMSRYNGVLDNAPETPFAGAVVGIQIENLPAVANVEIQKWGDYADGVSFIDGAQFRVDLVDDNLNPISQILSYDEAWTKDGKLKIAGLEQGTYRIIERISPDGYIGLNGDVNETDKNVHIYFTLKFESNTNEVVVSKVWIQYEKDGHTHIEDLGIMSDEPPTSMDDPVTYGLAEDGTIEIRFYNEAEFTTKVKFRKIDAVVTTPPLDPNNPEPGKPIYTYLDGGRFIVQHRQDEYHYWTNYGGEFTSVPIWADDTKTVQEKDEYGNDLYEMEFNEPLVKGHYRLVELEAPEGYYLPENSYHSDVVVSGANGDQNGKVVEYFSVASNSGDSEVIYLIKNQKEQANGSIILRKEDDDGEAVKGAMFRLWKMSFPDDMEPWDESTTLEEAIRDLNRVEFEKYYFEGSDELITNAQGIVELPNITTGVYGVFETWDDDLANQGKLLDIEDYLYFLSHQTSYYEEIEFDQSFYSHFTLFGVDSEDPDDKDGGIYVSWIHRPKFELELAYMDADVAWEEIPVDWKIDKNSGNYGDTVSIIYIVNQHIANLPVGVSFIKTNQDGEKISGAKFALCRRTNYENEIPQEGDYEIITDATSDANGLITFNKELFTVGRQSDGELGDIVWRWNLDKNNHKAGDVALSQLMGKEVNYRFDEDIGFWGEYVIYEIETPDPYILSSKKIYFKMVVNSFTHTLDLVELDYSDSSVKLPESYDDYLYENRENMDIYVNLVRTREIFGSIPLNLKWGFEKELHVEKPLEESFWHKSYLGYDQDDKLGIFIYKIKLDNFINRLASTDFSFIKVDLSTIEEDNPTLLEGAEFSLYACKYSDDLGHQHQKITATDTECWDMDLPVAKATSDVSGIAEFNNIEVGEYLLMEEKAPKGYSLPGNGWIVTIYGDGTAGFTALELDNTPAVIEKSGEQGEKLYLLGNLEKYTLPELGGRGTDIYIVIGIIIMTMSLILARMTVKHKRK